MTALVSRGTMSFVRLIAGIVALLVVVTACGSDDEAAEPIVSTSSSTTPTTTTTTTPTTTTSPASLDPSRCPVRDTAFCATAVEVAEALAAGDADRLLELSRVDRIECVDVVVDNFPGCATSDVIEGHGLSGPDQIVDLVDRTVYLDWLFG